MPIPHDQAVAQETFQPVQVLLTDLVTQLLAEVLLHPTTEALLLEVAALIQLQQEVVVQAHIHHPEAAAAVEAEAAT